MKRSDSVLVIAPSRKTRGGITSVVKLYEQHEFWYSYGCYWLETHIDKNIFIKGWYFLKSWITFLFIIYDFSIVHIHFSEPSSAFRKWFFFFPSWLLNRKIVLHFHSFSPDTTINSRFSFLYKWMFDHSDAVVVLSNYWKDQLMNILEDASKIHIIHNPAPKVFGQSFKEPYILFAGTINARKGYADLLHAFSYVSRWHKDWTLVMAGNGEIDKGKALCEELGVLDRVIFSGWIEGEQKDLLFKSASIFCLPSYAEGFPMAVIDAMSYGLPVVATPVGGLMDIFTENVDLLIAKPGAIKELAMKLDMLILSPAISKKLVMSSTQKIKKHFDLDLIATKLKGLYGQLSKQGR